MSGDRLRDVDDEVGRLARTRGARVLGWLLVGCWCLFVLWRLLSLY